MSNVIKFPTARVVRTRKASRRAGAQQSDDARQCVEYLESLLKRAQRGEVVGLSMTASLTEGCYTYLRCGEIDLQRVADGLTDLAGHGW
jgi:hypothetical protein